MTLVNTTKIEVLEQLHSALVKRMIDITISPHTPELDNILRKLRENIKLTADEISIGIRECDKEFWVAKGNREIGRAAALAIIIAQLESIKITGK